MVRRENERGEEGGRGNGKRKNSRIHGTNDTAVKDDIITDNGNGLASASKDGGHTFDGLLDERLVDALAEVDDLGVVQQGLVDGRGRVGVLALEAELLLGAGSRVLDRRHGGDLRVGGGVAAGEGRVGGARDVFGGVDDHVAAGIDAGEDAGIGILVDAGEIVEAILLEGVDQGVGGNEGSRQGKEDVLGNHGDG